MCHTTRTRSPLGRWTHVGAVAQPQPADGDDDEGDNHEHGTADGTRAVRHRHDQPGHRTSGEEQQRPSCPPATHGHRPRRAGRGDGCRRGRAVQQCERRCGRDRPWRGVVVHRLAPARPPACRCRSRSTRSRLPGPRHGTTAIPASTTRRTSRSRSSKRIRQASGTYGSTVEARSCAPSASAASGGRQSITITFIPRRASTTAGSSERCDTSGDNMTTRSPGSRCGGSWPLSNSPSTVI